MPRQKPATLRQPGWARQPDPRRRPDPPRRRAGGQPGHVENPRSVRHLSTGWQPPNDNGPGMGKVAADEGRLTVTHAPDVRRRVDQAQSLAEVLDAAYDAFEIMRSAIR